MFPYKITIFHPIFQNFPGRALQTMSLGPAPQVEPIRGLYFLNQALYAWTAGLSRNHAVSFTINCPVIFVYFFACLTYSLTYKEHGSCIEAFFTQYTAFSLYYIPLMVWFISIRFFLCRSDTELGGFLHVLIAVHSMFQCCVANKK